MRKGLAAVLDLFAGLIWTLVAALRYHRNPSGLWPLPAAAAVCFLLASFLNFNKWSRQGRRTPHFDS